MDASGNENVEDSSSFHVKRWNPNAPLPTAVCKTTPRRGELMMSMEGGVMLPLLGVDVWRGEVTVDDAYGGEERDDGGRGSILWVDIMSSTTTSETAASAS